MSGQQEAFRFMRPGAEPARQNLVIDAGAGTGKTTAIVGEVLKLLLGNELLQPERIALMTFTEKAAGEIADRIHLALAELQVQLENGEAAWPAKSSHPLLVVSSEQRDRYRRACATQLARIDGLRSQTIHSFCQSLLRAHPIEAGLDPQFKIIEGFERTLLYGQLYDAWLDRETRTAATPAQLIDWEVVLADAGYLGRVRELVFALLARRDLLEQTSLDLGSIELLRKDLEQAVGLLLNSRPDDVEDPALHRICHYFSGFQTAGLTTIDDWIEALRPVAADIRAAKLPTRRGMADLNNALKALRGGSAGSKGDSIYDALVGHRAAESLVRLTRRFIAFLDAEKHQRGVADFDDLLLRTLALLDDPAVLERVRGQFDFLFVDEFQDTDRTQAQIIRRIATDRSGQLVPGKLVIVGDPKQSIYGFRRADPETYRSFTSEVLAAGADRKRLDEQYRSDPELLGPINAIFESVFAGGAEDPNVFRPSYLPLWAALPAGQRPIDSRITFLRAEGGERGEAEAIAEWVMARRDGGARDLQRFALLFRRLTRIDDYLDVFERYGIDYVLPQTRDFLERRTPVDLTAVLRAIAFPFDRGAVVSAARTPFFALTDDEIAAGVLADALDPVPDPWRAYLSALDDYRAAARQLSLSALIDLVVRTSRIESIYAEAVDHRRSLRHLEHFRALAFEFDQKIGGSVRQFVAEIDRRREEPEQVEPSLADDESNAIRILSVHAAKGLEFETVILPDLQGRGGGDGVHMFTVEEPPSLVISGGMSSLSGQFLFAASGNPLKKIHSEREEAEMRRLFYVAVTRAMHEVVFVCNPDSFQKRGFFAFLAETFAFVKATFPSMWGGAGEHRVLPVEVSKTQFPVAFEQMRMSDPAERRRSRLTDPELEERLLAGPIAAAFIEAPAPALDPLDPAQAAIAREGARKRTAGTLLHRVLERWDGERDAEPLLRVLAAEAAADATTTDLVRRRLRTVRNSPMLQRIAAAERVGRELTLRFAEEGAPLQRRVDLLLRERERLVVVDYKSGSASPERLETDREQVARYCRAITAMSSEPCEGLLWYIDLDRDEVVSVEV